MIFSDESQKFIGEDQRIFIWRKPDEEGWRPDLLERRERNPVKVMIWGCICYSGVGTLSKVDGNINFKKYTDFLEDNIWPVIAPHFPHKITYFKTIMPLYTGLL